MNAYSRKGFRSWLESLPDEPFCKRYQCPISMFTGTFPVDALAKDRELAERIDDMRRPGILTHGMSWMHLKPREVIAIIDQLEAA